MKVRIYDGSKHWDSYVAEKGEDCKDETDRQVFKLVNEHDDAITMGVVIGTPMKEFEIWVTMPDNTSALLEHTYVTRTLAIEARQKILEHFNTKVVIRERAL